MLALVPARGGSKQIRRKNLRIVDGKPLLGHIIATLKASSAVDRVVVSTDDPTIAAWARLQHVEVLDRPSDLADDTSTVADVVQHAYQALDHRGSVLVAQPTCPLVTVDVIDEAIETWFASDDARHLALVADTRHLSWWTTDAGRLPLQDRVNRQQMGAAVQREVGVRIVSDPYAAPDLFLTVPQDVAVDIDTHGDLAAAAQTLGRRRVVFAPLGQRDTGAGHVSRCLQLADELSHHDVTFSPLALQPWARDLVTKAGYGLDGSTLPADLYVLDMLDTDAAAVCRLKGHGASVVTLEDLGKGAHHADLVVNELYQGPGLSGPRWAVLRPEFVGHDDPCLRLGGGRVLVSFGGTDPSRLGPRFLRALRDAAVDAVTVQGRVMAEAMVTADVVLTSAGRTVHEAAALGIPVVSVAANEREARHTHCPGVVRLGLHTALSDESVVATVKRLLGDVALRREVSGTLRAAVDGLGGQRIAWRIEGLLRGLE